MALLAGCGMFVMEVVLPRVTTRRSMLCISRMSMSWHLDQVLEHARRLGIECDPGAAAEIRALDHRYTSREFFRLLGFESYDDVDFDAGEGVTILHDMNTPFPASLHARFDCVFECGSIEHVFDVKTAIGNVAHAVREGGWVSHISPMDAFNHGFYNFSINFFNDFYRANGFTDLEFFLIRYARDWDRNQNIEVERLGYTHEEFYVSPDVYDSPLDKMYIACLARKERHLAETRVPIQAAYDPALGLASRLTD